jgi:uncharacterized membrane-anchored protein
MTFATVISKPRHRTVHSIANHLVRPLALAGVAMALSISVGAQQDAERRREKFNSIDWADGPATGKLGDVAQAAVPASCRFTEAKGTMSFMEFTENPTSGDEVGTLLCETATPGNPVESERWFVIFEFDKSGYVKDDEKSSLDAAKILTTLQEGQKEGNKERRRLGWSELTVDGWARAPYYDDKTHNLTWAVTVTDLQDTTINHSVRLLGRGGVLKVDLVSDPGAYERALPAFDSIIGGTSFVTGQRYAEWREGDKVAAYGLTALVAGGAGAAAVKLGLFGKLWKPIAAFFAAAWKLVAVVAAGIATRFKSLFRRKSADKPESTDGQ